MLRGDDGMHNTHSQSTFSTVFPVAGGLPALATPICFEIKREKWKKAKPKFIRLCQLEFWILYMIFLRSIKYRQNECSPLCGKTTKCAGNLSLWDFYPSFSKDIFFSPFNKEPNTSTRRKVGCFIVLDLELWNYIIISTVIALRSHQMYVRHVCMRQTTIHILWITASSSAKRP